MVIRKENLSFNRLSAANKTSNSKRAILTSSLSAYERFVFYSVQTLKSTIAYMNFYSSTSSR